VEGIERS